MKQTAVDWLVDKLDTNLDINHSWRSRQYIEQAKEMEKEQIMDAHFNGQCDETVGYPIEIAEQYYKANYQINKK